MTNPRGCLVLKPQLAIRWDEGRKRSWEALAHRFHKDPSVLARDLLEEFLATQMSDAELMQLGLVTHIGRRPGGLIQLALRSAERANAAGFPGVTPEELVRVESRRKRKKAG